MARPNRAGRPEDLTSALRSYLRFLAGVGLCRPNLDHAIPPVLQWRLSSLQRYLAAADVERVIASCDQLTRGRLRDRAILLLLARLGLRAGDVAGLRLSDIEWTSGMLRLNGKARRSDPRRPERACCAIRRQPRCCARGPHPKLLARRCVTVRSI